MAIPGYRILRKIRQGGMSTVYLAIQKSVDREVAIKVMSPSLSADPGFGSRFYREAKIVGRLSHPNIVSIYDVGSYKHYNYIAMDFLPGAPLQEKIRQGISTGDALRIAGQIAAALDYAHRQGYVHRDIKPDNILFRTDGSAVLCDFGIARELATDLSMTRAGSVMGTPHYMSPEQAQGKTVDGRSDLYSLGVVLYEMLTGRLPYPGEEPVSVAVKHMSAPIPKLPGNLKPLQPLVDQLLAKKPSARFASGQALVEALDAAEKSLEYSPVAALTQTQSTAVHVLALLRALTAVLGSSVLLTARRLLGMRLGFARQPNAALTRQQHEALDRFVLDDDSPEMANRKLFHDTGPIPLATAWDRQSSKKATGRRLWLGLGTAGSVLLALSLWQLNPQLASAFSAGLSDPGQQPAVSSQNLLAPAPAETVAAAAPEAAVGPAIEQDQAEPAVSAPTRFSLTVSTEPANATVRILNIKPRYRDGIALVPGPYQIEVSATDYHPQRFWLTLGEQSLERHVVLAPTRRLLAPGSLVQDMLAGNTEGPAMVVLPRLTTASGETRVLAISQHEIRFADYQHFVAATGRTAPDDKGWGALDRPVIHVSFAEANAYARWLSEQTGQRYRLPSTEEWHFAARADRAGDFQPGAGEANCRRGCDSKWSRLFGSSTAPVGSYPANAWKLHDMAGNVSEWLGDCQRWDQAGEHCQEALVAGGSHRDRIEQTGTAAVVAAATDGGDSIGLRLVLEL